jgi:hypothetical protein
MGKNILLCFEQLNEHIKAIDNNRTNGAECLIQALPLTFVREFHDWLIEKGEIVVKDNGLLDVENTTSDIPFAIMTFIACGEDFGLSLESTFSEYKGANPKYSFPN